MAFNKLRVKTKVFTGSLFLSGVIIHFLYGNTGIYILDGITQNLALLSIILLAPLISIPLKQEGVIRSIVSDLKDMKDDLKRTYYGVFLFVFMLSPILNMGSLRIVHSFISELNVPPKILSNAYYNGFTPAVLWSPFFASVGIVLYTADLSFKAYLPIGLLFSFVQIGIALWILRDVTITDINKSENKHNYQVLLSFILYVLFILITLVVLESLTGWSMLLLVSILCLAIPMAYQVFRFNLQSIKTEIMAYIEQIKHHSGMEVALFLSAGLFGNALLHTPVVAGLRTIILWSSEISIFLLFLLIILFVTLLAMFGIHQIVSVPIVLTIIVTSNVDVSVFAAAFMCIFTWMLSASISPLNALNIIISSCVRTNGIKVAYKWNGQYFVLLTCAAMIYVYIINIMT
ncbi:hypothetical protein ACTWQB_12565 [Piscibacillus sp. B03]|uniref:hypothetical protein n=1 Tax=Piscibacillus sp. B03 TaxID=3457430 RepID=UPI003FCCAF17